MKNVPADYYERLAAIDETHWWAKGVQRIECELLGPWLRRSRVAALDAGCGTGGFLRTIAGIAPAAALAGVDTSADAIEVARRRLPAADFRVAPLAALPFDDDTFDIVALNDVLQHVEEPDVQASLGQLKRVLRTDGALVVRTNGARHGRRDRTDWRLYDEKMLRADLHAGGLAVRRMTFANLLLSIPAELAGSGPQAPTAESCGIPRRQQGAVAGAVGDLTMALEVVAARRGWRVPWGHTLIALAVPR